MSTGALRLVSTRGQSISSGTLEDSLKTNFLLDFSHPNRQEAFISFKVEHFGQILFNFLVAAGLTVGLVLYWSVALASNPDADTAILSATTFVFVILLSWFLAYVKKYHFRSFYVKKRMTFAILENFFMVAFSLILDLIVLMRVLAGACKNTTFLHIWQCNFAAPVRGMPIDSSICAIFVPLLCSMTLPLINSKAALFCYVVNITFIYVLVGVYDASSAISILAICTTIAVSIHFMYAYSQVLLFVYFFKTQTLQRQREDDAILKAQEMRHVIGKVAHDLKTPLSSLTYGLDSLKDTMNKVGRQPSSDVRHSFSAEKAADKQSIWSPASSKSSLSPSNVTIHVLHDFKFALESMQASHLQVMMILNRCIDYSTIANGLSLVPRSAPVSILHVVNIALSWASKVYDNREMVFDRILHGITTMVTDPIWLQDNLICLLGNALKFSTSGPVKVRVAKSAMTAEHLAQRSVVGASDYHFSHRSINPKVSFREEPELITEPPLKTRAMAARDRVDSKEGSKSSKSLKSSFSSQPWSGIEEDLEKGLGGLAIVVEELGSSSSSSDKAASGVRRAYSTTSSMGDRGSSVSALVREGVIFEVEDAGKAIGGDVAERLFLPADNGAERAIGGSGLGLFCLSERVKALGGRYGLVSPLQRNVDGIAGNDVGNLFWFLLPYVPVTTSSYDRQDMELALGSHSTEHKNADVKLFDAAVGYGSADAFPATQSIDNDWGEGKSLNSAEAPVPELPPPPLVGSLKILVVDDSPLILKMLKLTLQKRGHCVSATTNGYEALDMIKQGWLEEEDLRPLKAKGMHYVSGDCPPEVKLDTMSAIQEPNQDLASTTKTQAVPVKAATASTPIRPGMYDVMLLDIQMPVIDGLQVMQEYKKICLNFQAEKGQVNPPYGLIIIAMSANNDPASMEGARDAGADFFFAKPFDVESFQRVMGRLIPRFRRDF
eukprot:gene26912-32521_t